MLSRVATWTRKRKRLLTQARARLKHMNAKALAVQAFHLGEPQEVMREQNAKKKKRSLTSRFVHGELDIEFRGVLIIGARRGRGGLVSGRDL